MTAEAEIRRKAAASPGRAWPALLVILAIAFAASQLLDLVTAQGLSSTEPRGAFAEGNPLLAPIADPSIRAYVGIALKVALVVFVLFVAKVQRRHAIGAAVLLLGTMAGLFGAWTNANPWW